MNTEENLIHKHVLEAVENQSKLKTVYDDKRLISIGEEHGNLMLNEQQDTVLKDFISSKISVIIIKNRINSFFFGFLWLKI